MPIEASGVRLSTLDTERFGVVTARADGISARDLPAVLEFCDEHGVELLIARCDVEDPAAAHALESAGCLLMDTLVYYERDLVASPLRHSISSLIAEIGPGDADQVESIARVCFRNYLGHYHADQRLDQGACTEVYASWARSTCDAVAPGSFVLVTGEPGARTAFSAFRRNSRGEGELVLGAVVPEARGNGLYRQLTLAGMSRLQESGANRFVTSTHLGNWGAQVTWTAAGLRPARAFQTFHRWFERAYRPR